MVNSLREYRWVKLLILYKGFYYHRLTVISKQYKHNQCPAPESEYKTIGRVDVLEANVDRINIILKATTN